MSNASAAIEEIRRVVGDDRVVTDANELRVYESDGFPIACGLPSAVVFPASTQQIADCVKSLAKHGVEMTPRGSGTGLAGGCVTFDAGVILSTTRMTQIESIDLANRCAVVQAGVRNTQLSDAISRTGLHFSPDPSSQRASTIAGNVATNAGGINTLKHGVTSNHVLAVEAVLADGSIIQTRGDALTDGFGGDLTGLFCGSEGTLGLITRVWCRLTPKPRHMRTFYGVFTTTRDACQTVADVIASGIVPASMEMMDGAMIGVVESAFHYGFDTSANALLLLEIDGVEEVLDEQLDRVLSLFEKNHATDVKQCDNEKARGELWSARKRAFGAIGRISHSYCTQDACIPRSKLPEAMDRIQAIGVKYGLKITNVFHAGDGNVHPILLFDEDKPEEVQNTLRASMEILEYCVEIGGTITGEHGVGVEKLHLMWKMFTPDTIDAFRRIKSSLDPDLRFNDGKLIPSTRTFVEILTEPATINVPGGAL